LIFLPGVQEIRSCIDTMRGMLGEKAEILPLHANLSNDEQLAVFANTKRWKIIAATNVAEVSSLYQSASIAKYLQDVHHH
jgi:ATP-dependent RNA helicase DHX57